MVAKEEEDTVHHDDDDDDKEDDDDDDKEDEATQKSYSNRLQATTGETKSTCGFLGSLLRWSNKRQLDAKESVQPSTSKQKEDTPMLSDVQVGRNTPHRQIINETALDVADCLYAAC